MSEEEYLEQGSSSGGSFTAWPEIVGLHVVRKNWITGKPYYNLAPEVVDITYKGKIKLHGNNGGVVITEEGGEYVVEAQSRSKLLGPKHGGDLMGFAKWASEHEAAFVHVRKALKQAFPTEKTVVFGEWCGEGIQRNVALCGIKRKIFAVFSIFIDQGIISDPKVIASFFPPTLPTNLHIIPWMSSAECGEFVALNFNDEAQLETQVPKINELVYKIDAHDPWVHEVFGVSGPGEGVVWYPVSLQTAEQLITVNHFEKLAFKTKGDSHAVVKQAKPAQIKAEASTDVTDFVGKFVTDGRGEQGLGKVAGEEKPSKAHTGKFIQWLVGDVKKESEAELEASNLTWKQVEKEVNAAARKWFLEYLEKHP